MSTNYNWDGYTSTSSTGDSFRNSFTAEYTMEIREAPAIRLKDLKFAGIDLKPIKNVTDPEPEQKEFLFDPKELDI